MKKILIVVLTGVILNSGGCQKIEYWHDNPISGIPTKVLMHRGNGWNTDLVENTLPAAEYGLSLMDGIEQDIQYSKDGTLWLDHGNDVFDCDGNNIGCFQNLTDAEILAVADCDGVINYYTLESVFQLMAEEYPLSYISLDIKGQYCQIANAKETMRQMAQAVLALVEKYHMEKKVLVESSSVEFLQEMDDQTSVGQCFIEFSDLDKGLANAEYTKARGVSIDILAEEINSETVEFVHNVGYGLVVWTVNEPEDIESIWAAKPDFIETDNPDFKSYITKKK
jgi:glycerophosphoryl diester phosphodiesterase